MTLQEKIKQAILRQEPISKLTDNPNDEKYDWISSEDKIIEARIKECKIWYIGDSNSLLNFYTSQQMYKNAENPIYNRNKAEYFWGLSAQECGIKRIHSGVPSAIIQTITNVVGNATLTCEEKQNELDKLLLDANVKDIITQKQMPLTLALGYGAFKIINDTDVSDSPLLEWYNANDVDFVVKHGKIVAIVFKDYYKKNNKNYVLIEVRRVAKGNCYIEYTLCRLEKNNEVSECPLSELEETRGLSETGIVIENYKRMLAIPSVFFDDIDRDGYGKSILANKIDLFDDLDQDLSQASQTSRVSTPVEYIPADTIGRGPNGEPKAPQIYNRQFIASSNYPDGDGHTDGQIMTTQPQLNFLQYTDKIRADLDYILTGLLSPATLGIDVAKKDNAEAQREKEKITMTLRNNIIARQEKILKEIAIGLLDMNEYMKTKTITLKEKEYDIGVKFEEFATPTFEMKAQSLLPLFQANAISTELFVEKLHGEALSEEEKKNEIEKINEMKAQDNIDASEFDMLGGAINNGNDEGATITNIAGEEEEEGQPL